MKRMSILLIIITILSGAAFAQAPRDFYGVASWYGEELAGKVTASGQIFDPTKLTAAHKTLPFGTIVDIECTENGNKVQVVINDRGPFTGGRIIDVSKAAAERLGKVDQGTFFVHFTIVKEGTGKIEEKGQEPVVNTDNKVQEHEAVTTVAKTEDTTGYNDKTVEREVDENKLDLDFNEDELEKEFVTTEPEDENSDPANDLDTIVTLNDDKNIVDLDDTRPVTDSKTIEKTIRIDTTDVPQTKKNNALVVDETRVTPELLLTNDSVIKVEKKEIDKELDIEIETPFDDEMELDKLDNPVKTNKKVTIDDNMQWDKKTQPDYNADSQGYSYAVQVGAFKKEANALKLYDRLLKLQYPVFTTEVFVKGVRYIRVRIGYYGSQSQALSVQSRIQSLNLPAIIVKTRLQD